MEMRRPVWAQIFEDIEDQKLVLQALRVTASATGRKARAASQANTQAEMAVTRAEERLAESEAILVALCKRDRIEDRHLQAARDAYIQRTGKAAA